MVGVRVGVAASPCDLEEEVVVAYSESWYPFRLMAGAVAGAAPHFVVDKAAAFSESPCPFRLMAGVVVVVASPFVLEEVYAMACPMACPMAYLVYHYRIWCQRPLRSIFLGMLCCSGPLVFCSRPPVSELPYCFHQLAGMTVAIACPFPDFDRQT